MNLPGQLPYLHESLPSPHRAGPTYGGKNTPTQQAADAKNPVGAVKRDSAAMVKNASAADKKAAKAAQEELIRRANDTQ